MCLLLTAILAVTQTMVGSYLTFENLMTFILTGVLIAFQACQTELILKQTQAEALGLTLAQASWNLVVSAIVLPFMFYAH